MTLSVTLVVRPHSPPLADCLAGIDFADELIVLLAGCPERRAEIHHDKARIIEAKEALPGKLANDAILEAAGPWVFEVTPQDRVSPSLGAELRALAHGSPFDHHIMRVRHWLGGREIRKGAAGMFGKAAGPALFRKGSKMWGSEPALPSILLKGRAGPVLDHVLDHQIGASLSDVLQQLDRLSSEAAIDPVFHLRPPSMAKTIGAMPKRFLRLLLRDHAAREGGLGLLLSALTVLYPLIVRLKSGK